MAVRVYFGAAESRYIAVKADRDGDHADRSCGQDTLSAAFVHARRRQAGVSAVCLLHRGRMRVYAQSAEVFKQNRAAGADLAADLRGCTPAYRAFDVRLFLCGTAAARGVGVLSRQLESSQHSGIAGGGRGADYHAERKAHIAVSGHGAAVLDRAAVFRLWMARACADAAILPVQQHALAGDPRAGRIHDLVGRAGHGL